MIDKRKAIQKLELMRCNSEWDKDLNKAIDLTIKILRQMGNDDCISRQQAIESLDRIGSLDTEADREYARDIFRNIPPVTLTEQIEEWIRCKDRLPNEISTYLVSGKMKYDTDKEYEYFVDIADYTKVEHCDYMGKFGGFFQTCNDWYEGQQEYEILAWKPLPEPYREGEI